MNKPKYYIDRIKEHYRETTSLGNALETSSFDVIEVSGTIWVCEGEMSLRLDDMSLLDLKRLLNEIENSF